MSNRTGGDGFALVAARHAMSSSDNGAENYGALPSSYRRRVRKSRSLAAVRSGNIRLRLQRSVPFLRHQNTTIFRQSPRQSPHRVPWERQEEVVQLARAQYFNGSDNQDTESTSQYGPQRSDGREHRAFRKSVRSNDTTETNSSPNVKRSFSFTSTIRNRFRKVIGRSLSRKESLPPQQLEAQRNYFSEFDQDAGLGHGFDAYQVAEELARNGEADKNEFLEDLDTFPSSLTPSVSRESLHSTARSRVTSWTNSSATGSVNLRSGPVERNRLSIIKEDGGPHQPSSSAGRHFGGVDRSRESSRPVPDTGDPVPSIDSRRIYSALIKRIAEEEAEVERTKAAVEALNRERKETRKDLYDAKSTIRAVHSDPSLGFLVDDRHNQQSGNGSCSREIAQAGGTPEMELRQRGNFERRWEKLAEQQSQSSFFPFSSEKSPETPSPFKRFLNERRNRTQTRSESGTSSRAPVQEEDSESVVINRYPSNSVMNRPRFGLSTASIYSRTTNGGSNEQYRRPTESSEEVFADMTGSSETSGIATILPTVHVSYEQGTWNPWSDAVDQRVPAAKSNPHTREKTKIASDESRDEEYDASFHRVAARNAPTATIGTPTARTPKVQIVISADQTHERLREQRSADALSNISNKADDGSKGSGSLRKLSPGNLTKLFKDRKNQHHIRPQSDGKENRRAVQDVSSPISTPGRLRYSISTTPGRSHESPSDKHHLVARLSRPFNMDVPLQNRPFDSMYLGKRTFGHPDPLSSSRLSVAPANSDCKRGDADTTVLPTRSASSGSSAAKVFGRLGSSRMVSNFLKSRRGGGQNAMGGDPAFI